MGESNYFLNHHQRIERLVDELGLNREEMKEMLKDVISFRKKIDDLLPKKIDFRNKFIFEERMKTISTVLDTELKIRKQIDESIRSEISIRTKNAESTDDDRNLIEAIAKSIERGGLGVTQGVTRDNTFPPNSSGHNGEDGSGD